ncbi:vacuolar transporter chaperone [Starmerella bacillaris]|uniref:Vacuolar transporter chaperone n=1 Tax=Starmerella bacillaris TaxID=1247836 RepID=A0AAV5RDA4_STABA|nr:vacuolar transporter chaperone [Starmerella bacillaris]
MLFSQKLSTEIYEPWRQHYLSYDQLKKLLKEGASSNEWTDEDESRFVEMLDKELNNVYGFEASKYHEINDKLTNVEKEVDGLNVTDSKKLNPELEQILDDATHMDKFRRLNYTGFTKLVRKHDRLHPDYRVMPLLQSRLQSQPFYTDDYSPLLRRLGKVYAKLDAESGDQSSSSLARSQMMNSIKEQKFHSKGYVTLQFWVHPDDLMEVKTRILRRLPVLVYNREDEDENDRDPYVTSLYLDNADFKLYKSTLDEDAGVSETSGGKSLRFRWYGPLSEKPEIVLEEHNEIDGHITRINIKEKSINKFLQGDDIVIKKQARKMRERHSNAQSIEDYETAAKELMSFVQQNKLEPVLRTVYKRTAFEIPGDDRVRVILDQDILFLREDSFNKALPIRDPSNWHRADVDQPGINPNSLLRKGEFARFPYSVLEVRLKSDLANGIESMPWIDELRNSNLIKEVPHFTKFLQGVAVLFGENERLDTLPFWLSNLDAIRTSDHQNSSTTSATPGPSKSIGAGDATSSLTAAPSSQKPSDTAVGELSNPMQSQNRFASKFKDYKFDEDEDEFDSEDSGLLDDVIDGDIEVDTHPEGNYIGYPTRVGKLSGEESEDDEVDLPAGVEEPSQWIKNQSSPKVEAKVWLANERTFNKWLHITCLLSALTFTLYSSVSKASSPHAATMVSYILFGLTLFSGIWGYYQYLARIRYIKEREDRPMDAPLGPLVVSIGLLLALIINFSALYKTRVQHPNIPANPEHPKPVHSQTPNATNVVTSSASASGDKKHKDGKKHGKVMPQLEEFVEFEDAAHKLM